MNYSIMNFILNNMFEFICSKCKQNFQDNEIRCKDGKKHTDTPWTQTGIRGASSGSLSALGPLEADSALLSMLSAPFSSCYAIVTKRYRDTFLKSKETD